MIDPASMSAYQQIATVMQKAAPKPYQRLRAELRLHDGSCEAEFYALRGPADAVKFKIGKTDYLPLHKALKAINQSLTTSRGPGFSRAEFSFDEKGTFDFDIHHRDRLLSDLAAALRRQWPQGVEKLRLTVKFDSFGRLSPSYEAVSTDGRTTFLDAEPPAGGHFDDVRSVLADLWAEAPEKFQELRMELGQTGTFEVSTSV